LQGTGSGLDLFISKGIVEAHGGKVWAEAYVFIIVIVFVCRFF
jgi:signal transduction histidine kinase